MFSIVIACQRSRGKVMFFESCLSVFLFRGDPLATTVDLFKLVHFGNVILQIRSNLFSWDPRPMPLSDKFKLVHYVAQTCVGKWVVNVQLKYLLVSIWKANLKGVDSVGGWELWVDSRMGVVNCNNCDIWNDSRILRCGFRIKVWIIPFRRIFHENRSLWLFHYVLVPT